MNPILALIIANTIWGAASPIFKFSLQNIPPFTLAFIRFFFAGILLLPFLGNIRWSQFRRSDWVYFILGSFFGITVNITFFFLGLQRSPSINAPIISSSGPVFLYFLSIIFLHEKARIKVFLGMMIALLGVLIIILSPVLFDGKVLNLGELEGNLFFVLAMLGAVFHAVFYKKISAKIDAFTITGLSFFVGSLGFVPMMLKELQSWSFGQLDVHGYTGIIFGVLFSSALGYFLYNWALTKLDAEEVGIFTYIDPIVAVLLAVPLLGEYPTIYFFAGSFLVFGGIFLAEGRLHWHPFHRLHIPRPHVSLPSSFSLEQIEHHAMPRKV